MNSFKLNVCSPSGDPLSRKTWSGTPYHICNELKRQNYLGQAFTSRKNKLEEQFFNTLSSFYYLEKNPAAISQGFIKRYSNSSGAKEVTRKSNSPHTLHMGTLSLPFYKMPKDQYHYVYCDITWNAFSKFSTETQSWPERLIRDIEGLEEKAYHQCLHIFTTSEFVKRNLIDHYKINANKITVAGTGRGAIEPYFGPKNYSKGKILFAAKQFFERKGGFLVLEAFEKVVKENPSLELLIVGKNEHTENITIPNVKTFGFLSIEELQDVFNQSSLFLLPAINEPWGLVYLEALACRTPIVGINRNAFPEISGNGAYGFGINEVDSGKLAETILKAFADPKKLEQMGMAGQEFCLHNFSWQQVTTTIVNTIKMLNS